MKTILVGVNHHLEQFSAVSNGMKVELVHDTENRYSQYAVSVVVDGIGVIGHMTENYVPTGFKHIADEVIDSKTFINEVLAENKGFRAEILQKKPNGAVIGIVLDANDSNQQMEENNMINWTENTSQEVITVVGCSHNQTVKNVGDKVHIEVLKYAVCPDGHIKGTSTVFNENGERIGVLPQSENKLAVLNENRCVYLTNEQFKDKYASDIAKTEGYVITDISECGRYVKLGFESSEEVVEETTEEEVVVDEIEVTDEVIELLTMLQTSNRGLIDVEEVVEETTEEPVEVVEMEISEVLANDTTLKTWVIERNRLVNEVSDLNEQLKKVEEQLEYTEAKIGERVEAMTLIHEIKNNLSSMDIEDLRKVHNRVVNNGASSNEEDTTSSSNEEINNGDESMVEEKYDYGIVFSKNDGEVVKMANEINDKLQSVIYTNPHRGKETMFDIADIQDNKVFGRIDFNIVDAEHPNDEKKILDTVMTVATALGYKCTIDNMPNVDYNEYNYDVEIEL